MQCGCLCLELDDSDKSDQSHNVHVAAVTKQESPQKQSSEPIVPESELQSILHEYKDCFPESLLEGLPVERDVAQRTVLHPHISQCTGSALQKTLRCSVSFQTDFQERHHSGQGFALWGACAHLLGRKMAPCACAWTTEH